VGNITGEATEREERFWLFNIGMVSVDRRQEDLKLLDREPSGASTPHPDPQDHLRQFLDELREHLNIEVVRAGVFHGGVPGSLQELIAEPHQSVGFLVNA
jgi:hypothetical protein